MFTMAIKKEIWSNVTYYVYISFTKMYYKAFNSKTCFSISSLSQVNIHGFLPCTSVPSQFLNLLKLSVHGIH